MRRIQGTGSIFFDEKLGKYRGYITIGYDEKGKQIRKSVSGKTRKQVSDKLEELKRRYQVGFLDTSNQTFGEFLEYWLEHSVARTNTKSTYSNYKYACEHVLIPQLGDIELKKVGPQHLQMAFNATLDAGKGRTSELAYSVSHRALQMAVRWKLIAVNPATLVDKPAYKKKEMTCWNPTQIAKFLEVAKEDRHYALYVFLLTTGCRIGEALAIRWSDIDWDNQIVKIQRTLSRDEKGKGYFDEPKTAKSRRAIVLPELALLVLKQHRKSQLEHRLEMGELYDNQDLVFASEIGTALQHSNILRRSFKPLIEKAGVPQITIHQLRHSVATALISAGVSLKQVSEVLGHSSITVTGDVYSHVDISLKRETAHAMNEILSKVR